MSGWEKEIGWRAEALKAAAKAREPQDAEHVSRAKESYDREQAPTAAKAEPLRARSEAHTRENSRLRDKIDRLFDREKKQDFEKQRDRSMGRGL